MSNEPNEDFDPEGPSDEELAEAISEFETPSQEIETEGVD